MKIWLWITLLFIKLVQISFWYRRGLSLRSLIQPSEILPVELTGTHILYWFWYDKNYTYYICNYCYKNENMIMNYIIIY